jgi:hypothetical protein
VFVGWSTLTDGLFAGLIAKLASDRLGRLDRRGGYRILQRFVFFGWSLLIVTLRYPSC